MKADVTFIMPAHNAGEYIAEAIDSILAQTDQRWLLIIVNDASSDNTKDIAEEYALRDNRISVISCEAPSGSAFRPREIGVKNATTPFIAPVDADDRIAPDYLENLLKTMRDYKADAVYPLMYEWKGMICHPLIDPANIEALSLKPGEEIKAYAKYLFNPMTGKNAVRLTLDGWKVNCNGGIISRNLFLEALTLFSYDTSNSNADEILTRQILILSKCVVFTDEKYYYRVNPDSITRKYSPKRFDALKASVNTLDLIRRNYSVDSEEYLHAQKHLLHICAYYLQLINNEFPKSARKYGLSRIESARQSIDFNFLKPYIRPRLWRLMQLPLNQALLYTGLRDRAKSLKFNLKTLLHNGLKPVTARIDEYSQRRNSLKAYSEEIKSLNHGSVLKGSDSDVYLRNYYKITPSSEKHDEKGMIICPFDGTLRHGGLTDRLRGVLSTYAEAKRLGRPFRICWRSPFNLEDFLIPAEIEWRAKPEEIVRDTNVALPLVIQDIDPSTAKRLTRAALSHLKGQLHVYSNSDAEAGRYKELYNELFRPSPLLEEVLNSHSKELRDHYWAFAFRFIGLLGDFKDCIGAPLEPPARESLMKIARDEMLRMMEDLPEGYRVLVTSDSRRFLDYVAEADSRIYIVPGDIVHIDLQSGNYDDAWLKTFVDQYLLMGAERVYRMRTDGMYPTGFPKFAAEVGGAKFIDHKF